ncbi:cysteine hydrolase family protein [Chitinimonas koreensis]|uniref:cysteine hydrolase family protein n=1 Tax=Chitinimonas koreensis TaxID=356302 RepID=UPI0004195A65|nr:cysteine hydrolase family protein [Chitinimonas koreensis]QNM95922.1 cysteine hydrolase [Chitinimonas koreensis]
MTQRALLIIDVQHGLISGLPIVRGDEVVATIAGLADAARAAKVPVIYVQHDDDEDPLLQPGSAGWQIDARIAPQPGEPVVRKRFRDSFHDTTLSEELAQRGIDTLIVAGCMTQYCVQSGCASAVGRGYDVVLVGDAHGTIDTGGLSAAQIVEHHNLLLHGLEAGKNRLRVAPSETVLAELAG